MKRLLPKAVLLFAATMAAVAGLAQTNYLDSSFNHTGIVTFQPTPSSGYVSNLGEAIAQDSQGRIIIGGSSYIDTWRFALARFTSDGQPDTTFQHSGMLTTPTSNFGEIAWTMAQDAQNRILLAGFYFTVDSNNNNDTDRYAVIRYLPNGDLDGTFGINGRVYDKTMFGRAHALLAQPDGKTIVIGEAARSGLDSLSGFGLLRLLPNGQRDSTFGSNGAVITRINNAPSFARAGHLLSDGRILVAGGYWGGWFGLVRYMPDGTKDSSFGNNGVVEIQSSFGTPTDIISLLPRPDGSVVIAGKTHISGKETPAMACVLLNGRLSQSFGNNGIVVDTSGNPRLYTYGTVQLSDGEIIFGGSAADSSGKGHFALARYFANGLPDTRFNGNGLLVTQVGNIGSDCFALGVQRDDKVLAVGKAWTAYANSEVFAAARYQSFTPLVVEPTKRNSEDMRIFPNPADKVINVDCEGYSPAIKHYQVFSLDGRLLLAGDIAGDRGSIAVDKLAPGTYLLSVAFSQSRRMRLFVRE